MKIKGTTVPALTFFKEDGSIDEQFTLKHMTWVLRNGVNGLFVTGTYGSGYLMSPEERVRVYKIAKEASSGVPGSFLIAHVGTNDTASSVYLTEAARDLGYDAVSAVNPYTFKYRDDELVGYYSDLVRAAEDMPVFAYNNPGLTSKAIDFGLVKKFMAAGVRAMKDSSLNEELAQQILDYNKENGTDFKYISGSTSKWHVFRSMGIDTMIAGACNYMPELVAAMYRLSEGTDDEKFMKACDAVNKVSSGIKIGNSLVSSHIALASRGYDVPCMKKPLICPYEEYRDQMAKDKEMIDEATAVIRELLPDLNYTEL